MRRLLAAFVLSLVGLLGAGAAHAQIAFVQSTGLFLTGQGTSTSGTFAAAPKAGNTIVIMAWSWSGSGVPTMTVGDSRGNTYTTQAQATVSGSQQGWENAAVFSAPVTVTGTSFTVTVRAALSNSQISAVAIEYSGVGAVDQVRTATGTSATATLSTSAATSANNELVVSAFGVLYPWTTSFGSIAPASPYTLQAAKLDNLNYTAGAAADNLTNTAGVQSIRWSGGLAFQGWVGAIVTFKPANNAAATPTGFNAFETSTAAGSTTGVIKTKIAGTAFSLAVVALNASGSAIATAYTGTVTVELLDARDDSGALNTATNCRASWTSFRTVSPSPAFGTADNGRITVTFTEPNAWRDVVVRVTATVGGATVVGCSTDNFAIRPASFASLQATDATDATPGVARVLDNGAATTGVVHRAGRAFSLLASAQSSTGTTTSGYDGAPTLGVTSCTLPAGCTAGTLSASLVTSAGVVSGSATYSEAGVVTATLSDSSFAAIDAADSTLAERTITSSATTMGRFVPDAYALSLTTTPSFALPTCGAGPSAQTFLFVGQPFTLGTAPVVRATPVNASGQTLANAAPRFGTGAVTTTLTATNANAAFTGSIVAAAVSTTSSATITFTDAGLGFTRGTVAVASFSPTITWTVDINDTTETGTTGNGAIQDVATLTVAPVTFAGSSATVYYGQVRLTPSFGDYRRDLAMPLDVVAWNGLGWMPLAAAGACVTAPATAFAYSAPTGWLADGSGNFNCATRVAAGMTTANGRALITLAKPAYGGTPVPSATTVTLNLLASAAGQSCSGAGASTAATTIAMPWLATPAGANPAARLTWGRARGPAMLTIERFD